MATKSRPDEKKRRIRPPRLGYIPRGGDPEYLEEMKQLRERIQRRREATNEDEEERTVAARTPSPRPLASTTTSTTPSTPPSTSPSNTKPSPPRTKPPLETGHNGLLLYQLAHTLHIGPTGINAPGQHHTTHQATADARENTPGPPTNTDHAHQTYHAGP